jgi:hypothetical protein
MNAELVVSIINIIVNDLLPNLSTSGTIQRILAVLVQAVPIIVQEVKDMVGPVQNIIAALRSNGAITPEQLDQLDSIEAQLDVNLDAAAQAAQTQDSAGS